MILESKNDPILQEDLEVIANSNLSFEKLTNKNILITGATGLVGSQLTRALLCCNRIHKLNLKVYILIRNEEKARMIFGDILDRNDIEMVIGDVLNIYTEYIDEKTTIDYIFHAACVTASKVMIEKPVDTIYTSLKGTNNILKMAVDKKCKGVVYISSMEMYGQFEKKENSSPHIDEDMLGYINPLKVRSNYPESKRMCENMCIAYVKQYNVPICIARLSQTFGAGILQTENRVFAQFARSVIRKENIVLHTLGKSEGNYCYTRDTVIALIMLLLDGERAEAYNISNEESHTTIGEMAQLVCEIAGNEIKTVFDIPIENSYGYAADTSMKLNTKKMRALGWKPEIGLKEAYIRLIESMKYTNNY